QHATPLRAVLGEQVHAECFRLRPLVARPWFGVWVLRRRHDVFPGAKAVIEDDLRLAVAVGIETAADVRKGVPLRRVLQRHQHDVVADDVGQVRAVLGERVAEVLPALVLAGVAYGRRDARRVTPRVECGAAGIVEGERQAEGKGLLQPAGALQQLLTPPPAHAASVDPLEVVDRFGEGVDALLRDLEPGRNADFLAGALLEAANGDGGRHCFLAAAPSPWRTRSASASDAAARRDAPPGSSSS